jgi:hypothetical protein
MTKVGTLVEDLTGTPATGFVVAELVLAPPVVDPFDIDEATGQFPADELYIDAPIADEIFIEAWIGTEGTEIGEPEDEDEPEEPDDELEDALLLEDGEGFELEDDSGYIEEEA